MFLKNEFSNRLVQVSLFSAIVYYITAYPVVFESARKYFPIKFKKTHHLLIFHTFVFMVLMYVLTYFVFDPIVRVVEGSTGGDDTSKQVSNSDKKINVTSSQIVEGPKMIDVRAHYTNHTPPVCDPPCNDGEVCESVLFKGNQCV